MCYHIFMDKHLLDNPQNVWFDDLLQMGENNETA